MSVYSKGEVVELIKLEIKDGERNFTADIYTLINLINKGRVIKEDVFAIKYNLKITDVIAHDHDYYGYIGTLLEVFNNGEWKSISDEEIVLHCQKDSYERHRYFLAGIADFNPYDYYWVNRNFGKYGGLYFTAKDFIYENIVKEYPVMVPFFIINN